MPKASSEPGLPIGLVTRRGSLATRIRKVVKASGLTIVFEATPDELEDHQGVENAEVVVVVGSLESHEGSLLSLLRVRLPDTRLVVCSEPVESPKVRWAIDNGADGLVWDFRLEESFEPTVLAVRAGQVVMPREILRRKQAPDLTNREKQALSMVIMGLTNLEIAQKLYISENTVKSHLNTAYKKLGVHSRAEAQRLITDPDQGLGTGILAITAPGLTRGRPPRTGRVPG
jgi:DNA-binding NarL/FixJ family response regulator